MRIHLESAGFGIDCYNRLSNLDQQHPAKLLQEVRSTIRSARTLMDRVAITGRGPTSAG
ncbi:hypothetical protein I551_2461 [Mycobacterium ulcerans str. Harvey]|uniref:Uncharacterized protein n=1 Tax=Mycobacterium ulcerans str. Harvey TaxID=1299332 RepID=A0ABN0R1R2_MYCUL|nr:hypothetical protein I551_2461 [Mycobacterium ulcerans str. Harvey]